MMFHALYKIFWNFRSTNLKVSFLFLCEHVTWKYKYIYMYKYVTVYFSNLNICLIMLQQRNNWTRDSGGSRIFRMGLGSEGQSISVPGSGQISCILSNVDFIIQDLNTLNLCNDTLELLKNNWHRIWLLLVAPFHNLHFASLTTGFNAGFTPPSSSPWLRLKQYSLNRKYMAKEDLRPLKGSRKRKERQHASSKV